MFDVPVVMLVYRRPDLTARVLDAVRRARPRQLLVVADGPRDASETGPCRETRGLFAEIDWPCEVRTDFSAGHLGCGRRVASGLDWVFRQVPRAVVLEDDVVPEPSFFPFCEELLDRYQDDERVMQIGGTNVLGSIDSPESYVFSKFVLPPWGWATWARAWRRYDFFLEGWDAQKVRARSRLGATFPLWEELVDGYRRTLRSWDLQWNVALWCHGGVTAVPAQNLTSNLGYGEGATFTRFHGSGFSRMPTAPCPARLHHPADLEEGMDAQIEPAVMEFIREIMKQSSRNFRPGSRVE